MTEFTAVKTVGKEIREADGAKRDIKNGDKVVHVASGLVGIVEGIENLAGVVCLTVRTPKRVLSKLNRLEFRLASGMSAYSADSAIAARLAPAPTWTGPEVVVVDAKVDCSGGISHESILDEIER